MSLENQTLIKITFFLLGVPAVYAEAVGIEDLMPNELN